MHVPESLKTLKLCEIAYLQYIPEKFRNIELCTIAVEINSDAFEFVPNHSMTKEICWIAIAGDLNCYNLFLTALKLQNFAPKQWVIVGLN